MSTATVKKANSNDASVLAELLSLHDPSLLHKDLQDDHIEALTIYQDASPSPSGAALVHLWYSSLVGQVLHVQRLFVRPDLRRRGLAKTLCHRLKEEAKRRRIARLAWSVAEGDEGAVAFSRKVGGTDLTESLGYLPFRLAGEALGAVAEVHPAAGFRISPVELSATGELEELERMIAVSDMDELGLERTRVTLKQRRADVEAGRVFADLLRKTDSDGVVGFVLWSGFWEAEGGRGLWMEDLFVGPEARGLGLGKALVGRLARVCKEEGLGAVRWEAIRGAPSVGFYRKMGAENLDETKGLHSWTLDL